MRKLARQTLLLITALACIPAAISTSFGQQQSFGGYPNTQTAQSRQNGAGNPQQYNAGATGQYNAGATQSTANGVPQQRQQQIPRSVPAQPQGPRLANRQGPASAPLPRDPAPPFGPLTEKHQKYLDQVLQFWEFKSKQIKHYQCQFRRWEYDPIYGPQAVHKTYSTGVIKYAEPDKGMFEVTKIYRYTAPSAPGEKPQYVSNPQEVGEKWICDGASVFQFDATQKKLRENVLPPEMRGKAIVDGPLPFVFGAEAAKIKARYWVHIVTPEGAKNEYWIEAFPKFRADAANFQSIVVIIDGTDYLPKAIEVRAPSYQAEKNESKTVYTFEGRVVNSLMNKLNEYSLWSRAFFRPATPTGWERVVYNGNQPQPGPGPAPGTPATNPSNNNTPTANRGGAFPR